MYTPSQSPWEFTKWSPFGNCLVVKERLLTSTVYSKKNFDYETKRLWNWKFWAYSLVGNIIKIEIYGSKSYSSSSSQVDWFKTWSSMSRTYNSFKACVKSLHNNIIVYGRAVETAIYYHPARQLVIHEAQIKFCWWHRFLCSMFPESYRRYRVLKESISKIGTEGCDQVLKFYLIYTFDVSNNVIYIVSW